MGCCTVGQGVGITVTLPLVQVAVVQLLSFQDSPFCLGGFTLLQSREVVDEGVDGVEVEVGTDVVGGTELEIVAFVVVLNTAVVEGAVELGVVVVGHGLDCVSTLQDALQYAR